MGTSTEQARQAVGASRGRLEASANRLEAKLRLDLDPRRRLRRDGPKLAAAAGAAALVATVYLIQVKRRRPAPAPPPADWTREMPEDWRRRLQELLAEAADHTGLGGLPRPAAAPKKRPLGSKLALRALRMAAPMVLPAVAERLAGRQGGGGPFGRSASPHERRRWWEELPGRARVLSGGAAADELTPGATTTLGPESAAD